MISGYFYVQIIQVYTHIYIHLLFYYSSSFFIYAWLFLVLLWA